MKQLLMASAALLAVAACSTFETADQLDVDGAEPPRAYGAEASYSPQNWRPQEHAGITSGRVIYPTVEGEPVVVELMSGKEAEDVEMTFTTPDGNLITYSANGLAAFQGQLARADVEKVLATELSDMWENLAPEIRGGIVDTVCTAFGACL